MSDEMGMSDEDAMGLLASLGMRLDGPGNGRIAEALGVLAEADAAGYVITRDEAGLTVARGPEAIAVELRGEL